MQVQLISQCFILKAPELNGTEQRLVDEVEVYRVSAGASQLKCTAVYFFSKTKR